MGKIGFFATTNRLFSAFPPGLSGLPMTLFSRIPALAPSRPLTDATNDDFLMPRAGAVPARHRMMEAGA
jgi:hypothetical protein